MKELADIHVLNAKGVRAAIAEYEYIIPEGHTRKGYMGDLRIFYDYLSSRGPADASITHTQEDLLQAQTQVYHTD